MSTKGLSKGGVTTFPLPNPTSSTRPLSPSQQTQSQGSSLNTVPTADIASGCLQGCAFSFLWMFLFQAALSVLDAFGVPCAAPLAAGCVGGACGAVQASRQPQHRPRHQQEYSTSASNPTR